MSKKNQSFQVNPDDIINDAFSEQDTHKCSVLQSKAFQWNELISKNATLKFTKLTNKSASNYINLYLESVIENKSHKNYTIYEIMEICRYLIEEVMLRANNTDKIHFIIHNLQHLIQVNNKFGTPLSENHINELLHSKTEANDDLLKDFMKKQPN